MKLINLFEEKKMGIYVGVRLSKKTKDDLQEFITSLKIPNPTPYDKFHSTLIYSRKYVEGIKVAGTFDEPIIAKAKGFKTFETQEKKNALVLELNCKWMIDRHQEIMREYGTTYDYPEYIPHLTLSYDCGDFDPKSKIPDSLSTIEIVAEYKQDLDLNWRSTDVKDDKRTK